MKIRQVDRFKAKNYLKKAEECLKSMEWSYENNSWNSCVINAIHCAISSADAFSVFKKEQRSASERHEDVMVLFLHIDPNSEEIKKSVNHLSNLLKIKTDAEYGERLFYQKDAEEAIKHAKRLFNFVKERIS